MESYKYYKYVKKSSYEIEEFYYKVEGVLLKINDLFYNVRSNKVVITYDIDIIDKSKNLNIVVINPINNRSIDIEVISNWIEITKDEYTNCILKII